MDFGDLLLGDLLVFSMCFYLSFKGEVFLLKLQPLFIWQCITLEVKLKTTERLQRNFKFWSDNCSLITVEHTVHIKLAQ
jgi:hypothetical protein